MKCYLKKLDLKNWTSLIVAKWGEIPAATLQNLVESPPRREEAVLAAYVAHVPMSVEKPLWVWGCWLYRKPNYKGSACALET